MIVTKGECVEQETLSEKEKWKNKMIDKRCPLNFSSFLPCLTISHKPTKAGLT